MILYGLKQLLFFKQQRRNYLKSHREIIIYYFQSALSLIVVHWLPSDMLYNQSN